MPNGASQQQDTDTTSDNTISQHHTTTTTTKTRRRGGRPTAHQALQRNAAIIADARLYPGKTVTQLAIDHDVKRETIDRVLRKYGSNIADVEDYKRNRADILAGTARRILTQITDEDIQKSPLRDKIVAIGILHDKERLERGQSTANIANLHAIAGRVIESQTHQMDDKSITVDTLDGETLPDNGG